MAMWENVIVAVIVGAAGLFVGHAAWRTMRDKANRGCQGCNGCGGQPHTKGACHGIDA
jgi:hypothetical protein